MPVVVLEILIFIFKNKSPRKGTEFGPQETSIYKSILFKNKSPRKGTEFVITSWVFVVFIDNLKTKAPVRGRSF